MRLKAAVICFVAGVMVAITGAAKLPAEPGDYPDTWPVFAGGFILAVVGLVLWWQDVFEKRAANAELMKQQSGASHESPIARLEEINKRLGETESNVDGMDAISITEQVEELVEHHVQLFAEERQQIIDLLGMRAGAEVLVTAAFAERMLNRAWSAAADGHVVEARSALRDSAAAFRETEQQLTAFT